MRKLLSCMLALLLVLQFGIIAFAAEETEDHPYVEKQTFIGENALRGFADNEISSHFNEIKDRNELTVVAATVETVYVIETISENGGISDSRLMNATEVTKYENMRASVGARSTTGNTWIGEDEETHNGNKLSIYLVVYKDSSKNYLAYGTADWDNGSYSGGVNGPSSGYDFIAITWGGSGELVNKDYSVSGEYRDGQGNITFSRANSDTYSGYCWQFNETKGLYFASYIDCYAKISKTYTTNRNKVTDIKLTYIHTYQEAVGSISFSAGTSGAAGGVSLSSCDKQWQIQVSVPGIAY